MDFIREWFFNTNSNIVEPTPVKGGIRYKKWYNFEDFGIEIPKTK